MHPLTAPESGRLTIDERYGATEGSAPGRDRAAGVHRSINLPLLGFLALLPFQWITLASIAGGSIKVAHAAVLIPIAMLIARVVSGARFAVSTSREQRKMLACYLGLVAVLGVSIIWSGDPVNGVVDVVELSCYFGIGAVFYLWMINLPPRQLLHTAGQAVYVVAPAFLVVYLVAADSSGVNVPQVLMSALSSGTPNVIQYQLFLVVFNNGAEITSLDDVSVASSNRHGIMLYLLGIAFLFWNTPPIGASRVWRITGHVLAGGLVLFVLLSLSRSAWLALLAASAITVLVQVRHRRSAYWTLGIGLVAVVGLLGLLDAGLGDGVSSILHGKFVDDIVNNPRVFELMQIAGLINERPVFGYGAGEPLELVGLAAEYPHNLVLYHWFQSGFIGLLLATVLMFLLARYMVRLVIAALLQPDRHRAGLLAASAILLAIPLFRMIVAKAGTLALTEWWSMALAIALLCAARRLDRSRGARGRRT